MQPVGDCLGCRHMCREELCLKAAVLAQIHHGTDPKAMPGFKQLFLGKHECLCMLMLLTTVSGALPHHA